jgi:hypothetical protein
LVIVAWGERIDRERAHVAGARRCVQHVDALVEKFR